MRKYGLQENINGKWVEQAESNSRELLVRVAVLDFENSETRIVIKNKAKKQKQSN